MKIERIMMIRPGRRFPRIGFSQPLGLLYLISVLREEFPGKFEIDLVEQALYDLSVSEMRERFRKFNPQLVCFSALSMEGDELKELASMVKKENPNCITILGGPHASIFYDLALEDANIDIAVIGEGERTLPELLKKLINDEPIDDVSGIAFLKDGKLIKTRPREFIEDLDSIPFPAWDMVNFKLYHKQVSMNTYSRSKRWAVIFTSRACPFKCSYCHNIFGKKVRKRSVENVMQEIELLVNKYGIEELQIVDDIFNIDLERAKRICDEIVNRKIKVAISFPNGLRADLMDRELIQKLKSAGCYVITYAIETASPRLQKLIRKNLDLDKAKEVIRWTYEEGIIPQAFLMLGFPTETLEEIQMTIDYTLNTKLLRAWYFTVVVYPRTDLMEIAKQAYPGFDFSNSSFFDLRYWAEKPFYSKVTGIDLYKIQSDAYKRFFFRPKIIFQILWRFPKNSSFFKGMYFGLRASSTLVARLDKHLTPIKKFLNRHLGLVLE